MPVETMSYRTRIVEEELALLLGATGAVLVEGAKACGKTATAMQAAASAALLDVDANIRRTIDVDPGMVLRVRRRACSTSGSLHRQSGTMFGARSIGAAVLASSSSRVLRCQQTTSPATPAPVAFRDCECGPFPCMSLVARREASRWGNSSKAKRNLRGRANCPSANSPNSSAPGVGLGTSGGQLNAVLRANRGYVDETCRTDITRVDGKARDPVKVERLIRSLARNVATPVSLSKLATDVGGANGQGLKPDTASEYVEALHRLMVLEDQPAWAPHLRSRKALRSMPVRHFVDLRSRSPPCAPRRVACSPTLRISASCSNPWSSAICGFTPKRRMPACTTTARRTDSKWMPWWRPADGRWAAFEIKLGERWIPDAQKNLLRLGWTEWPTPTTASPQPLPSSSQMAMATPHRTLSASFQSVHWGLDGPPPRQFQRLPSAQTAR